MLTDDISRAKAFNEYFLSVFTHSNSVQYAAETHPTTMSDNVIFSPDVVCKALHNAKHTLSSGPDAIPSLFWAKVASAVSFPVSVIFTSSYMFSKLPDEWKCATVRPLFKKGNPSITSNYRPISLTCTLCKVMETIIKDNLLHFALSNSIIAPNQYGFLPNRSTCSQMLDCNYEWRQALDNNNSVDVIFIDFSKAFDVVPHAKLIHKLAQMGICDQTLKWLQAFLAERRQVVDINGTISAPGAVTSGVVQGSVVGPILFVLYINDLPAACRDCIIALFADDAKAYKIIKTPQDRLLLQLSLTALWFWALKWDLQLSVDKCLYLQLGYTDQSLSYTLGTHILKPCNNVRDLGITIQSNLKPGMHCTEIAHKANIRAMLILKSFLSQDPQNFIRAFIVYVRPLLEYCTPVWCPFNKGDIDVIENVQRYFTRKVSRMCHLAPTSYSNRLSHFNLQRLELRRIHSDLLLMYKITHSTVHTMLSHVIRPADRTGMNTRGNRYKLNIARTNKQVFSSFFTHRVAPIWNFLPDYCFYIDNISSFKRKLHGVDFSRFLKGRE